MEWKLSRRRKTLWGNCLYALMISRPIVNKHPFYYKKKTTRCNLNRVESHPLKISTWERNSFSCLWLCRWNVTTMMVGSSNLFMGPSKNLPAGWSRLLVPRFIEPVVFPKWLSKRATPWNVFMSSFKYFFHDLDIKLVSNRETNATESHTFTKLCTTRNCFNTFGSISSESGLSNPKIWSILSESGLPNPKICYTIWVNYFSFAIYSLMCFFNRHLLKSTSISFKTFQLDSRCA